MRERAGPDASICLANTRGDVSPMHYLRHWPTRMYAMPATVAHQISTQQPIVFIPDRGARTACAPWTPKLTTRQTIAGTASQFGPVARLILRRTIPQ
jgi:hypothetical protein